MENEIQTKMILWLESAAQNISNFAKEEIPPFIHEYLTWKFLESGVDSIFPFVIMLIGVVFLYKIWGGKVNRSKTLKVLDEDNEGGYWFIYIASTILALAFFILGLRHFNSEVMEMIQIKVAPKVYLIEKGAELIKGDLK